MKQSCFLKKTETFMVANAEIVFGEYLTASWNARLQIIKYVLWENKNVQFEEGCLESAGACLSFQDVVLKICKDFDSGFANVGNAFDEAKLGLAAKKICFVFLNLRWEL